MRLPEVRDSLIMISQDNRCPASISKMLRILASEIKRRPPVKRAEIKSRKCTPELRKEIRKFSREYPKMSQVEIARHFNVHQGRVSEAVRGFRR